MPPPDLPRIITRKQLLLLVPYTVQHIGRLEKTGKFPKRIPIGSRRVGWWLEEILAWLAGRGTEGDALLPVAVKKETKDNAGSGGLH